MNTANSRRRLKRFIINVAAVGLLTAGGFAESAADTEGLRDFERSTLRIVTPEGTEHWFSIHLAISPWQRARGLSFVKSLPPDQGMLFLFPRHHRIVMWMKDTLIPLDMLFIAPDGRVLQIEANTMPGSLQHIRGDPEASAVLELNGGTSDRLGIRPGARVLFPSFEPAR